MHTKIAKITAITTFLMLISASAYAAADGKKNVLILNSYHQGFKWTDDETRGITSGLFPENDNLKIYIEYMGTKWNFSEEYFRQLSTLYKKKFRGTWFDIIICTDDDAFNFLKQYRDEVFGRVPVVFCGCNWIEPGRLSGIDNVTGVNEAADIPVNIYLMQKMHPNANSIFVIMDSTTTGNAVYNRLNEIITNYRGRLKIIPLYNIPMDELLKRVAALGNDSLILLTIYSRDSSGRFFEFNEYCKMITAASPVPVYALWDFYLGYGIVGGNLTSGYQQGLTAGNLALRILKGEPADSIPVIMNSPNTYMFDYIHLGKYGIGTDSLPSGSIIINEPASFYSVNKKIFQAIIAFTAALAVFTILLIINIRRRYSAEKSLSESVEKYSTLVNNLNVGVFRSSGNPDGNYMQVNPAMMKIFGYDSSDEFMSLQIKKLYQHPDDRKRFIDGLKTSGTVKNLELSMKKKDGTPIPVSVSGTANFNESRDEIIWIDGILEDITDRKKMETEIRHAQKMDTIGTLSSGIAHDFNNALGGIVGVISILDHKLRSGITIPSEKLMDYITIMKESGEKGSSMVQRLLSMARKEDTEYTPSDINSILRHVVELLSGTIDKSIEVRPVYLEEKAVAMADAAQIEQAILNLCINAGHAMTIMRTRRDQWGGTLTLEISRMKSDRFLNLIHPEAAEKEYWNISISDTGAGMPENVMERIFEPFFTTKVEGFGTGLGLAMVKRIITEHGGFIDVYSEPEVGSTFRIYLPVSHEKPESQIKPEIKRLPEGRGIILVVEDEPVMMKVTREILLECGYDIITADNGESAVRIFSERNKEISAVLMDMAMPVMSGLAAYSEMIKIRPDVKVLITSGFRQDIRIEEVLAMGAAGFIEKPYTLEKLGLALKDILDSAPSQEMKTHILK